MKISLPQTHKLKPGNVDNSSKFQKLVRSLAQNCLVHLEIGFEDNEIRTKRSLEELIKAVNHFHQQVVADKYSSLETIRIGWKLKFALGPILQKVLPILLKKPSHIRHLELNLDAAIPAPTLQKLIGCTTIEKLTLRSISILNRSVSDPIHDRRIFSFDSSWADDSVVQALPSLSPTVRKLNLIDCEIQEYQIPRLCDALQKKRGLQALSLRHNRNLEGGWEDLFSLHVKSLDLSLCDLDPLDGMNIARALRKNRTVKRLSVAGNYRMTMAIPELVEVAAKTLVAFDCSFCEINDDFQSRIFKILANADHCTIRSLIVQGARIKDTKWLIQCLKTNKSIQRLDIHHPRDASKPIGSNSLTKIIEVVKKNYYLQALKIDVLHYEKKRQTEMNFWLQLNKCGRRVILQECQESPTPTMQWMEVLRDAGLTGNSDLVYWMLQNGAELFSTNDRSRHYYLEAVPK
ncbi:unnamed protein product [Cylindrotheca closterium]|uniref:RNI-like protein n=1 Tax=Cylindrotheca closterium TaxID=2856 RepID=A0AAD2PXJ3_9STRA|nr:unnamed protein product [Cylindrotheca closterium]